jgi:hypothetical protein
LIPAIVMWPTPVFAQTEPRVIIDVSANGAADSNPFFEPDGDPAFSATLQVDPKVYWEDETTSVVLDASLRMTQYLQNYGNDIGGRVGVLARKQLNTRTSLNASAGFQSSRSRVQDFFLGSIDAPLDPVEFPDVTFTDVTTAGRRNRVQTLDASVGIDHILSEEDTVSFVGMTSYSRFSAPDQRDFRTASLGTRYRRQLSERTSVNAALTGTIADYLGTNNGDARIISPLVGIENKVDERISWTASVGVSLASVDDAFGEASNNTYLTGAFSICDKGIQSALCGSVSRSAEPTALGGIRAVTNVAVVYDKQLSQKERVILSGRYGQTSQGSTPLLLPGEQNSKIYGVAGTYSKEINDRLSFVAAPSVTKYIQNGVRDETNYAITIGIRLRLGKLR